MKKVRIFISETQTTIKTTTMTNLEIFNQYVKAAGYEVITSWENKNGFTAIIDDISTGVTDPLSDFTQSMFINGNRAVRLSHLDLHNEDIIKGRVKFN